MQTRYQLFKTLKDLQEHFQRTLIGLFKSAEISSRSCDFSAVFSSFTQCESWVICTDLRSYAQNIYPSLFRNEIYCSSFQLDGNAGIIQELLFTSSYTPEINYSEFIVLYTGQISVELT